VFGRDRTVLERVDANNETRMLTLLIAIILIFSAALGDEIWQFRDPEETPCAFETGTIFLFFSSFTSFIHLFVSSHDSFHYSL
jgi:hypothetical protein